MKKSKRFSSVLRVAEAREKQAVTAMGEAQTRLQAQITRLEELKNYQQEYHQQLQRNGSTGMDANRMLEYRRFLDSLKIAIEQQETIVSIATRAVEEKRQLWFGTRNKLKSYDNVMTRYQSEEQQQEDRKEQQETDERASNSGNNKSDNKSR